MTSVISFIMECFSLFFGLVKKPVSMMIKKYVSNKNNVNIFITGFNVPSPFSLDTKKSSKIDFGSWHEKIKSGGTIVIKLGYVNEVKKHLKKKNISEKERKVFDDGIRRIEKTAKIMEIMIKKSLLEECISNNIQSFSLFIENVTNKCFESLRGTSLKQDYTTLAVYSDGGKDSFQFNLAKDEYNNVLDRSNGKIKFQYFIFFNEFMNCVDDKSIMEREIMPIYLKILAIKEENQKKEVPCVNFSNWWISVA